MHRFIFDKSHHVNLIHGYHVSASLHLLFGSVYVSPILSFRTSQTAPTKTPSI